MNHLEMTGQALIACEQGNRLIAAALGRSLRSFARSVRRLFSGRPSAVMDLRP